MVLFRRSALVAVALLAFPSNAFQAARPMGARIMNPMHQQPPPQMHLPDPQPAHQYPHHFQQSPPMTASQHRPWGGAAADTSFNPNDSAPAPRGTEYGAMNALLAQLHSERVRAGARPQWVEEPDDEDDW